MSRYVDIADPPPTETPESQQLLDAIGRRMLRRRVDALKSLPTFPESVIRINQILAAEDTDESFERIAAVIEIDPVLTARVLRLVNSAFYGVSGAVATVYDALVMLGLDVVKGLEPKDIPIRYRDHALFAAFAPVESPEIVVVAVEVPACTGASRKLKQLACAGLCWAQAVRLRPRQSSTALRKMVQVMSLSRNQGGHGNRGRQGPRPSPCRQGWSRGGRVR